MEPDAGDEVTVRFRTARDNVDIVWLCTGDKKYKMKKTETEGAFDYYEVNSHSERSRFTIILKWQAVC